MINLINSLFKSQEELSNIVFTQSVINTLKHKQTKIFSIYISLLKHKLSNYYFFKTIKFETIVFIKYSFYIHSLLMNILNI